jgi:glutamate N-acetyltransferase/amino-acid N-acetyltransferase
MMKNQKIKEIAGSVCAPEGFYSAGIAIGIKKSKKKDLALVYSTQLCSAAAVFTANSVKAAPVIISQQQIKSGYAQAVIINSGNANACTGKAGLADARHMADLTAEVMQLSPKHVLVASTGIIGVPLPMKKIVSGIWSISRMIKKQDACDAAEAILTTDLRKKTIAIEVCLEKNRTFKIAGMAKGSGMICPHMATMIGTITTDVKIEPKLLQKALSEAVSDSFNVLTVDNDMSTNDTVFALASGLSEKISGGKTYALFLEGLKYVCTYLAKEIARDGEGATKLFTVKVKNARSVADARKIAKTVAGSNLFKCAVYGADPNWGRIAAAVGYSGVPVDPGKIDIYLEDIQLMMKGLPENFNVHEAVKYLKNSEISFTVDLHSGKSSGHAFGCDMTEGYININAKYHT